MIEKQKDRPLTGPEFTRLANNFYNSQNLLSHHERIGVDSNLINYFIQHQQEVKDKTYKVAMCCICLNPRYWQFINPMIAGARQFLLPGHQVDFFMWTDLPELSDKEAYLKGEQDTIEQTLAVNNPERHPQLVQEIRGAFKKLQEKPIDATIIPMDAVEWPYPTLMRYHSMLQQEEKLKDYDYIFYCDIDMVFVNIVGDEILGDRLTGVQQPMYAIRKEWWPPYEPNPQSKSYIPRLGKVIEENGKPRFMPLYLAGGFQGGKSGSFIEAMKVMKKKIDDDLNRANYIPIWNDETVWNSYWFENPSDKDVILTPSYTYPDSLINEYFVPLWGCNYPPRLVTLTKKFSFTPGAGEHLVKMLNETKQLK